MNGTWFLVTIITEHNAVAKGLAQENEPTSLGEAVGKWREQFNLLVWRVRFVPAAIEQQLYSEVAVPIQADESLQQQLAELPVEELRAYEFLEQYRSRFHKPLEIFIKPVASGFSVSFSVG